MLQQLYILLYASMVLLGGIILFIIDYRINKRFMREMKEHHDREMMIQSIRDDAECPGYQTLISK